MASAFGSFKQAFASYKSRLVDYTIYSVIASIAGVFLDILMVTVLVVMASIVAGAISTYGAPGASLGLGVLGLAATIAVILVGFITVAWVLCGLLGAYLSSAYSFLSNRGQTIMGFISSVPPSAGKFLLLSILLCVIIGLPAAALIAASTLVDQLVSYALIALALLYAALASMLLLPAFAALIVDGKSPFDAVKSSIIFSLRNFPSYLAFLIVAGFLSLPMLLVLLAPFYYVLFYMPFMSTALLAFYKSAR